MPRQCRFVANASNLNEDQSLMPYSHSLDMCTASGGGP